tara:strand:- start:32399 stop:32599 length:201 start_codon:yes stop_codon:yes gene_type:complete
MNLEKIKLVCIKSKQGGYTVFAKEIPMLIVEVENLNEAPSKLAEVYRLALEYGFDNDLHIITELSV